MLADSCEQDVLTSACMQLDMNAYIYLRTVAYSCHEIVPSYASIAACRCSRSGAQKPLEHAAEAEAQMMPSKTVRSGVRQCSPRIALRIWPPS